MDSRNNLLTRFIIVAASLALAAYLVKGIYIDSLLSLILSAIVLGIVNSFIRPLFIILTIPLTVLSLGLFLFIINGIMLIIAAALVPGFHIRSTGAAIVGWIIISLTGWIATKIFTENK